jgi:hypothetical protein
MLNMGDQETGPQESPGRDDSDKLQAVLSVIHPFSSSMFYYWELIKDKTMVTILHTAMTRLFIDLAEDAEDDEPLYVSDNFAEVWIKDFRSLGLLALIKGLPIFRRKEPAKDEDDNIKEGYIKLITCIIDPEGIVYRNEMEAIP